MQTSIQHFLDKGTERIQEIMLSFWADPSKMAEMIQGISSVITELGTSIIAEEFEYCDELIRKNPKRKADWHIVRKDPNTVLTGLGSVTYTRTLFKEKSTGKCAYLLDQAIGIRAHERMTEDVEANMLKEAVVSSYRKGGEEGCITDEKISGQTVMNKIRSLSFPKSDASGRRRCVEHLFIDCDEDHVSLQHAPEQGPKSVMPKIIYLYEGIEADGKRHRLVGRRYFGGLYEGASQNEALWEEVSRYIEDNYDESVLKSVYINGDGANWIKAGVPHIPSSVFVLDKFHMCKSIRSVASHLGDSSDDARDMIYSAIYSGHQKDLHNVFSRILKATDDEGDRDKVKRIRKYLIRNWDGIQAQISAAHGCSAEGHVSHVYAARMSSRPLGWSRKGADQMARLRVYMMNGGDMLELVRYQNTSQRAECAKVRYYSCAAIKSEETRQRTALGALYGAKMYSVPAMISKMFAIKERIWAL